MSFLEKVFSSASQGAAGAIVGAGLSSVTEPMVNRVLVERVSLAEALRHITPEAVSKYFNTTLSTNLLKFPLFEIVNMILKDVDLPDTGRGAILGAIFTTVTLPITNYRYCKSVGLPVDPSALYKAYLPTVGRDIVYGVARNTVASELAARFPELQKSAAGRFVLMFLTVAASCLLSAPGNELRGFYLQPEDKKKPMNEFFKPYRFIRSTTVGMLVMSTALAFGSLVTQPAQEYFAMFREYLNRHPLAKILLGLFVAHEYLAARRHSEMWYAISERQHDERNN